MLTCYYAHSEEKYALQVGVSFGGTHSSGGRVSWVLAVSLAISRMLSTHCLRFDIHACCSLRSLLQDIPCGTRPEGSFLARERKDH